MKGAPVWESSVWKVCRSVTSRSTPFVPLLMDGNAQIQGFGKVGPFSHCEARRAGIVRFEMRGHAFVRSVQGDAETV